MSKAEAVQTAITRATESLANIDWAARCQNLGLDTPADNRLSLRMFGQDMTLDLSTFELTDAGGLDSRPADLLLLLHYLQCEFPVQAGGELVSYRSLSGGQFYYGPFQSRTVNPLVGRHGHDLDGLRKNLDRFDHERTGQGDVGARIHALGNLYITLVVHEGDDEFPASADVLFDDCISRVYDAENAAVMASRICIGLL
jgi:hypothetical protein